MTTEEQLKEIIAGLERRIAFALGQHYEYITEWENNARQALRWLEISRARLSATQSQIANQTVEPPAAEAHSGD